MTGRPIMVHRSPLLIAACRSPADAPPSVDSEPVSTSAVAARRGRSGCSRAGRSGLSGCDIVVPGGRIRGGVAGTNLRSEKGEAVEDLAFATKGWRRDDDGRARSARCRRRTTTDAGSVRPVNCGRRRADGARSAAGRLAMAYVGGRLQANRLRRI